MFKKYLFPLLLTFSASVFAETAPTSGQISEPKYKLSDTDAKIWIRQVNNVEQCIFPDLAKPGYEKIYEKWTTAESLTMRLFQRILLRELIGVENDEIIDADPASSAYLNEQVKKFNHQRANVNPEQCEEYLKPRYKALLEYVENELPKVYR